MTARLRSSAFALTLSLAVAAPLSPAAAYASNPSRAVPEPELHLVFTTDDYPTEALVREEEGTVSFNLTVGVDGGVSDCAITASSGSASLDATTCRILSERARFKPAIDANGKAVTDFHRSRVVWRIPEEPNGPPPPPRVAASLRLWTACMTGEVAKLVLSTLSAPDIAKRAFAACVQLEERTSAEIVKADVEGLEPPDPLLTTKEGLVILIGDTVRDMREVLGTETTTP